MKLTFIAATVLYSVACVAAPSPHRVESRRAATKPWTSYEAFSVDRIPGFTPSPDPALDEYGGWLGTHVGNPDGFFRVRKINGRWWMVDPAGNLFLAKAVAGFKPGAGGSERQKAALKDRFGGVDGWVSSEVAFLKSCGFNSLGSWSEHKAYGKPGQAGRIPYTVIVSPMAAHNRSMKKAGREAEYFKGVKAGGSSFGFPFVFDPEFEKTAERVIAPVAKYADDPYLIGYFIDNEVQFRRGMLWQCLTAWPKGHANRIAAQAWLDARKGRAGCTMRDVTEEDRLDFVAYCVDIYLGTVTRILRKYDRNHMFLGCRFNIWDSEMKNPACFRVAGRYMDVVSINHYGRWQPDMQDMKNWEAWSGKPFMVTEFYVKGEDSGLANTTGAGWLVHTQDERGIFYQNFVNELIKGGACVGWHWFKYGDNDPTDPRNDPSNRDSNKGMVTWDYRHYEPLADRMREINNCTYNLSRFHEAAEYDVTRYGARPDGETDNTAAIQKAIDDCSAKGGGRVLVPGGGKYVTYTLNLKNNVDLHIERGATLLGGEDPLKYPLFETNDVWNAERAPRFNRRAMFYTVGQTNVAITGAGAIDGNAAKFHHRIRNKNPKGPHWRRNSDTNITGRCVFFVGCRDVRLDDVLIRNPCGWSTWFLDCDRVGVRGVRIDSFWVPNGDGLHFGGCRDVVVSDCVVESRDDAFIVRTHQEQMKRPRPCERMVVNNCVLHSAAASAIRFGWTGDGPIRDVSFNNIVSPQARYGVSFFLPAEPPPGRECMDPPRGRGLVPPPVAERLPFSVENVRFSNMSVTGDGYPIYVAIGADAQLAGIKNVSFSDCRFSTEKAAHVDCRPRHNVRGWSFNGTTFEVKGRKTGIGKALEAVTGQ